MQRKDSNTDCAASGRSLSLIRPLQEETAHALHVLMAKTVDDRGSRGRTDASRQCWIRTQRIKILFSFNVRIEQESVLPVLDQFAVAARTPNYDGQRASHRLDDDSASSLGPGRVSAIDECIQRSEKVAGLDLSGL